MTKTELQTKVDEAVAAADQAQGFYLSAVRLRAVAALDEKEAMKEWKRADIAKRRALGALAECEDEDDGDIR